MNVSIVKCSLNLVNILTNILKSSVLKVSLQGILTSFMNRN